MKIGIIPRASNTKSGGYQYSLSAVAALTSNSMHDYYFFINEHDLEIFSFVNGEKILIDSSENLLSRTCRIFSHYIKLKPPFGQYRSLNNIQLDILILLSPASLIGLQYKKRYIVPIHDLMHRYYPNYPENKYFNSIAKDLRFRMAATGAAFTIVDSEQSREDIFKFYGVSKERIKVIPFVPPPYIFENRQMPLIESTSLIRKFNLPSKFIFYPAQFWYHKNHIRLLHALKFIKDEYNEEINLVTVGTDRGVYKKFKIEARRLSVENQIYHLGYVDNKEIVALYKHAVALVFPSLFGPTNIPIVESILLSTPVVCSNLFAMPEQIGDGGLLFDPFNPEDIAEKIHRIWSSDILRKNMITNCRKISENITLEGYWQRWQETVEEALS